MLRFIARVGIYTVLFLAIAALFPRYFFISSFGSALIASVILVILNATIKPFLNFVSLPITMLTFGFFTFIISAITLELTSWIVGSTRFNFTSFWSALFIAILISICNSIINSYLMKNFQKRV
ncbi:phage holin family protein [Companilactobacillus metriopterae]|uniref:phage holin family protein n=1 Tax=Companilactobacillus metriopterae TaxID=1909267 RepID=UPI00100B0AF3|nr:phage holin family protein [Companilactobacillus metriopterae]